MDQDGRDVMTIEASGAPVLVGFAEISEQHDPASALAGWAGESPLGRDVVAVVSADLGARFATVLQILHPVLREIVCCDGVGEAGSPSLGSDLATRALDELGIGQDFVYTVPAAEAAVDHAVRTIAIGDSGWTGQAVLVVGSPAVIDRVRNHLSR